jgi:hypothetical protein
MADDINLNGPYNTKIPSYNQKADIQEALRLFLYGDYTALPTNSSEIVSLSLAGHLKSMQEDITALETIGTGSEVLSSQPTGVPDGFIWVDSTTSADSYSVPMWKIKSSGNLSGESLSVSSLNGEKLFIVLKDWSHNNAGSVDFSLRFNADSGPNYVNTGGLVSASHLSSPEFPPSGTYDMTVSVDLANTESALKPVSTIADIASGSYFGYYKNTSPITSIQVILPSGTSFDSGSYEVWSYE